MNEELAIRRLIWKRQKKGHCLPRFTRKGWWEADVFLWTAANVVHEFEVKLSRSDFRADSEKVQRVNFGGSWADVRKHRALELAAEGSPNYFWFVCPEGVIDPAEVPAWAGLIILLPGSSPFRSPELEAKKAPKLHTRKLEPDEALRAIRCGYFRYLDKLLRKGN